MDKNIKLRLKTLEDYNVLDTLPEQLYDDITQVASYICGMPIALLSLVDNKRQFFKSKQGIPITETPIQQSVCYHALLSEEEIFEVLDLRTDERFKSNPLVLNDPNLVSYFGVPLQSYHGVYFGSLCVISQHETKEITQEQKEILKKLARQVVYLLETRRTNNALLSCQNKIQNYITQIEAFAHTAAHDLRAPLRAVKSFLQLIEMKNEAQFNEKDKKYFTFIYDNVTIMDDLVLDLLEFAKSEDVKRETELLDLNIVFQDIFQTLLQNPLFSNSKLVLGVMPRIHFSKVAIQIVFKNLIENALKYKKKDSTAIVEIRFREDNKYYYFEVQDNGIGIDSVYFDLIFKPFKRLHTKTEYSGSGLGLASVKKILSKVKGTISVASVLGEGTIFALSIPKE